jgi:hypothetical protein
VRSKAGEAKKPGTRWETRPDYDSRYEYLEVVS